LAEFAHEHENELDEEAETMAEVSFPLRIADVDDTMVTEGGAVALCGFGAREIESFVAEARTTPRRRSRPRGTLSLRH
jgi:hypothetical protein